MVSARNQKEATDLLKENIRVAEELFGPALAPHAMIALRRLTEELGLALAAGDVQFFGRHWYVTNAGLLRLAKRAHCFGIAVHAIPEFCDPAARRWTFQATVYTTKSCKGFVGYGDAEPSNVSEVVRGAEMRVAETRAVNRALRKAYAIGICSAEEIGPAAAQPQRTPADKKVPCGCVASSGNGNGDARPRLRDRLRQLIRQHQLDPILVKSYAVDFCGTKTLADASREQIRKFVDHLARRAATDRDALASELNRYAQPQERAS